MGLRRARDYGAPAIRTVLWEFWSICRLRVPGMQGWHGGGFGRGGTEQYRCARFPASWSSHSEHPIVAALSPPAPSPASSSASAAFQHAGDRRTAPAQPQYAVSSGESGGRPGRPLRCAIESQERGKHRNLPHRLLMLEIDWLLLIVHLERVLFPGGYAARRRYRTEITTRCTIRIERSLLQK